MRQLSPPQPLDLSGWGLIVVDMQNDFLTREGYYARRARYERQVRAERLTVQTMIERLTPAAATPPAKLGLRSRSLESVVRNVCTVIEQARAGRLPIAHLKAVYHHRFKVKASFFLTSQDRRHYPCKPGTWGQEFINPIQELIAVKDTRSREKVIVKHTFNGFHETPLRDFLQRHRVHTVMVAGVETHVCVMATALAASFHQFKPIILTDCTATAQKYRGQYALNLFRDGFGTTCRSTEIFCS